MHIHHPHTTKMKSPHTCPHILPILLAALLLMPLTAQAKPEMYARMSQDSCTLTFYYDENKQAGDYAPNYDSSRLAEWVQGTKRRQQIKTVIFDTSFRDARPTICTSWFEECENLESIHGIENLNTSQVTHMREMFYRCKRLTSLDLTHFNTENVTSMRSMFKECDTLDSLDFSSFNTSKVTTIEEMFGECKSLSSLDLSSFDTRNVTSMSALFAGCVGLRSVNLSTFDTSLVPDMSGLFAKCTSLESLDLSGFNTERVTNMSNMFSECESLQNLNLYGLDTRNVTDMYGMFQGCAALRSLDLSSFDTKKVENMRLMFYNCQGLQSLDLSNFSTPALEVAIDMFCGCSNLQSIDLTGFCTEKVEYMRGMFQDCTSLRTIYASSAFTTDQLMSNNDTRMFDGCTSLPNYSPEHTGKERAHIGEGGYFSIAPAWVSFDEGTGTLTFQCNSSKPEDGTCYDLDEGRAPAWSIHAGDISRVVFSRSFRDARPSSCATWFMGCGRLARIDGIENLNTSQATSLEAMFYGCQRLTSLDLSHLDTGHVTSMSMMFKKCPDLASLNLKGLSTENVTTMQEMFCDCPGLRELDLPECHASQVTTLEGMFSGCASLTVLDLSRLSTPKVKYMDKMFLGCSSLRSLDLSGLNTASRPSMSQTFDYCSSLRTIYVGGSFLPKEGTNMFRGCENLQGAAPFDGTRVGMDMANYVTGYLTRKVGTHGGKPIGAVGDPLTIDSLTLRDGQTFTLQVEKCRAASASYSRPMDAEWGTLCLPFDIDPASAGNTCDFYTLLEVGKESLLLGRIGQEEIAAGTPVIVRKKDKGQTAITITATHAATATTPQNALEGDRLVGTFGTEIPSGDCYFIARDKFRQVSDYSEDGAGVKVNAFRAYIQPGESDSTPRSHILGIMASEDATSVNASQATAPPDGTPTRYYDLGGRLTSRPQRGLSLIRAGGKVRKIIIK